MFDQITPNPLSNSSSNFKDNAPKGAVEDIFAGTEQLPSKPPIFQPKAPNTFPTIQEKPQMDKKYFILGFLILLLLVILVGGIFGVKKYSSSLFKKNAPAQEDASQILGQQETNEAEIKKDDNVNTAPVVETPSVQTSEPNTLDSDQDGLTDNEEDQLGTDKEAIDSDNDGLFDREEVKVYNTDARDPDTDGDTFKDGDEVKNGYNPKGEGKLFEIK